MTKKRYSVSMSEITAHEFGPEWETWEKAFDSRETYISPGRNCIWRHNDDGTVTDVTDGEPEMDEPDKWWRCAFVDGEYGVRATIAPIHLTDMRWRDGELEYVEAILKSTTAPTPEQFQAHVLAETGVTVPCVPEKAQWWNWTPAGWDDTWGSGVWLSADFGYGRLYGTVFNRDEKRDALLAAAKAAGKDGAG